MGKDAPSPPAAPDPNAVSQAQTQSNQQTALYNFGLNNPNYNTPLGSLTYTQTGGGPQYNTDAYNKALAAWQANGASNGSSMPAGLSYQQWLNNGGKGGYVQYGLYQNGQGGTSSNNKMPQLSDFLISSNAPPQYTANVSLSPDQQKLYNAQTQQSLGLSNIANQLMGSVGNAITQPTPTYSSLQDAAKQAQDAYYKQQTAYLDPQYSIQQEQLDNQLANQGVMPGSEAYQNAEDQLNRNKTFAYNQAQQNAITAGPQNAQALFGLQASANTLPLNELDALRSGSQVQMPQVPGTTPSMAQPTNTAQNTWNAFGAQQNAYNQGVATDNANTQGMFGLAGSALGAYGSYMGLAALA